MPVLLEERDEAVFQAVKAGLAALVTPPGRPLPPLDREPPSGFGVSTFHRTYDLELDRVDEGNGVSPRLVPRGWRCLLHGAGGEVLAAVEVDQVDQGEHRLGDLSTGPQVDAFIAAIGWAEEKLKDAPERFRPTLLEQPALLLSALWLRRDGEEDGFVAPIAPLPDAELFPAEALMPVAQFIAAAGELARRQFADAPPEGAGALP